MNTNNFTNLIQHFIAYSASQSESNFISSYPNISVFRDGEVAIATSPDKLQPFVDCKSAINHMSHVDPLCFPLEGLEDAIASFFSTSPQDTYIRFYPMGFNWEYGRLETGGLEAGETIEQLQAIINNYAQVLVPT